MTAETLAERDRTSEELDALQREWLAADDTSMGYRDAREDYLLALADAYEGGELVTRAEVARLVAEAVEMEREGCARIAWESEDVYGARNMQDMAKCARNIAAAIRAREGGENE